MRFIGLGPSIMIVFFVPETCVATVDFFEADTDKGSWLEIWAAAVAVNELCIVKGTAGTAFDLGNLILSIPYKIEC